MKIISIVAILILCGCFVSGKQRSSSSLTQVLGVMQKYLVFIPAEGGRKQGPLLQAFNVARYRIENYRVGKKPLSIITDIDETLLDYSPYEVDQTIRGDD